MAFTLISGNETTAVVLDDFDDFLMLAGASLVVEDDEAIEVTGNNQNITILGVVYTDGGGGTGTIEVSGDSNEFYIGKDGFVGNSDSGSGNFFVTGDSNRIVNDGVISGGSAFAFSGGNNNVLINFGSIHGLDFSGVTMNGGRLENHGEISGGVDGTVSDETIINTGIIEGNVVTNDGADTYNGLGGRVTGSINLGAGTDTAFIDDPEAVIAGGSGDDTLVARSDVLNATEFEEIQLRGDGDFRVVTDDFTALVSGNAGSNDIIGSSIANTLLGRAGNDVLEGLAGNDTLRGDAGDDILNGGNNDDRMFGGTGDDTLFAGNGQDVLRGNQGADTFVYEDVSEMGTGSGAGTGRDIIFGFERGADVIDVSAINDASFAFIGTNAFSATGDLEVRFVTLAAGHTRIEFDEDGDGIADGELLLRGVTTLDADDFVL